MASNNPKDNTEFLNGTFPEDFVFGYATAAYPVEGAWDEDGKGPSIWDEFVHQDPSPIADKTNGDVAADSYHKYKEDVQLVKNGGGQFYRFTLSWSRLLPNGTTDNVNQAGVDYYNSLIDECIANGIKPHITLYHWDLPQALQVKTGGWINEETIPYFVEYARFAFKTFGDRVKFWLTFNQLYTISYMGYGYGTYPPGVADPKESPWKVGHNVLRAHSQAYHAYVNEFKELQGGKVGLSLDMDWYDPTSDKKEDIDAAERGNRFRFGWWADPLFHGDYSELMRSRVDAQSKAEGKAESVLPTFTCCEKKKLKGSFDFIGISYYTMFPTGDGPVTDTSFDGTQGTVVGYATDFPGSATDWLFDVPWALRCLLRWIKDTYSNPEIYVFECGTTDNGAIGSNDANRITYFRGHLNEVLKAIVKDGCKVKGFTAYSLLDGFDLPAGYAERYGIYAVEGPEKKRIPKDSAAFFKKVYTERGFPA